MGARPAVAVIDSLAAEGCQQEFLRSRTPSSLSGAARALFVHHLAQNGAAQAHHIIAALSVGRNDAVLYDFERGGTPDRDAVHDLATFLGLLGRV